MRLKIFVVAYTAPKPDVHACQRRFRALLEMMARRHRVVFAPLIDEGKTNPPAPAELTGRYERELREQGVELLPPDWAAAEQALGRERFDVGFFEYWRPAFMTTRAFRRRQPTARVVIDSVDVHFERERSGVELGVFPRNVYRRNRWREVATYRYADAVVAISDPDKALLLAEGGMPEVEVLPIVVPLRARQPTTAPEVLFVGGFAHHPNLDGILWFVKDVWSRVRERVSGARLTVVGSNPPPEVIALGHTPGVEVAGWVPETVPYLDRAAVSVAPLRYGGGMKGKVSEALASGIPVVTTTAGAAGFYAKSGEHLLVADAAEEFAQAVVALLHDPERAERMGRAGQQLVGSLCSPEAIDERLEALLQSLCRGSRRPRTRLPSVLRSEWRWLSSMVPRAAWEKLRLQFSE